MWPGGGSILPEAEHSGPQIQLQEPELLVASIRDVLSAPWTAIRLGLCRWLSDAWEDTMRLFQHSSLEVPGVYRLGSGYRRNPCTKEITPSDKSFSADSLNGEVFGS
jgi:hypothetical protein